MFKPGGGSAQQVLEGLNYQGSFIPLTPASARIKTDRAFIYPAPKEQRSSGTISQRIRKSHWQSKKSSGSNLFL